MRVPPVGDHKIGIGARSRHVRLGRRWGHEQDLYAVAALQHGAHGPFVKGAEARNAGLHWTRRLALRPGRVGGRIRARYREPVTRAHINHVSIVARDLQHSVQFYIEIFGAETIDTPNFGFPVQWLRVGDLQLHLFERPGAAPAYHHFALGVDDFEAVFRATRTRGLHDVETMGSHLNELPSGQVQLYIRDPGGNLVEVNWNDARGLSDEVRQEMRRLEDSHPQSESNRRAELYLADSPKAR